MRMFNKFSKNFKVFNESLIWPWKKELSRLKQDVEASTKESNWVLNERNPKYKYSSQNVTNSCWYGTYTYIRVKAKSWLMMLLVYMEKNWENASDKARSDYD